MHEMGIANSVIEAVRKEVACHPGTVPCKVGVRIGEMTALDEEALRFCFEALIRDTSLESLQLEVELCPRRHRCSACGREFVVLDYEFACPQCENLATECISGDELELAYLEVEDYGACTAGEKSSQ
jgi:hydrogenase nickel incorporation protein HypA/HybF